MADLPKCPNFTRKRGCARSAIRLVNEDADCFYFVCETCKLNWMVSKPSAASAGINRAQQERLRLAAEHRRRVDARRKIFT